MIKAVVFDIGNVLLRWDPRNLYRKLIASEAEMEYFLTHICTPAWNAEQDRGRPWSEAVAILSAQHPEYAALIRAFDERWHETVQGTIPGTVEILSQLAAANVPLYALTNFSTEKFAEVAARFDFFSSFKGIVVSGAEKLIKPDPAIYHVMFKRYGIVPEEAAFIDDSQRNVDTAASLGMTGLLFTSPEALHEDLANLGLLARH